MKRIWSRLLQKAQERDLQDPAGVPSSGRAGPAEAGGELRSVVLRGHSVGLNAVAFSPAGGLIASGSGNRYDLGDDSIRLWSVEEHKQITVFQQKSAGVESIAFTPDGSVIAAGLSDYSVVLHSVPNGAALGRLSDHLLTPSIAFSPDGKTLAAAAHRFVTLWAAFEGRKIAVLAGHHWYVTCVAFSPDGELIVSGGSEDDETVVWALPDRPMHRLRARSFSLAFSADGEHLACGCHGGILKVWSRKGWKELLSIQSHQDHVASVAYSNDGLWMATGSYDNSLKLWRVPNYHEAFLLQAHEGSVYGVAFSPDSKLLASASSDKTLRLWHLPG